jgi:hypothetical protein
VKNSRTKIEIPRSGLETPLGNLYDMPSTGKQIFTLVASFFIAILLGFILSSIPGDLSELATGIIYFIFILIFFIGYSVWMGWLKLMLLNTFKKTILKGLSSIVTKKEFDLANELSLPDEKLIELMVRSQKATWIFALMGWLFGIPGGIVVLFFDTQFNKIILCALVLIFAAAFGHLLYYFGRRGYFPFPEE